MPYKLIEDRRESDRRRQGTSEYKESRRRHYLEHRAEILQKAAKEYRGNREKKCEDVRRYYWENRAKILEYKAKYNRDRRAEIAPKKAKWQRDNRKRICEARRRVYPEHREEILAECKKYYEAHREQVNARIKRQRETPRGRLLRQRHSACRRAEKVYGASGHFTIEDVLSLLIRQKEKCALCKKLFPPAGTLRRFDIDHIVPLGRGSNGPENIQLLCQTCNKRKGNRAV